MNDYTLAVREVPGVSAGGHLYVGPQRQAGPALSVDSISLLRGGRRRMPVMGEFHYSRYPEAEWRRELLKMRAGGIDVVASYVFWIHHQEEKDRWDWTGCRDLGRFVRLCGECGMLFWLRVGPWCHGECRNGGFPDWLRDELGIPDDTRLGTRSAKTTRTAANHAYMALVRELYRQIAAQVEGLWWCDGGPIIGVQLENEFCKRDEALGEGTVYIEALRRLALESGMKPVYVSITGWGAAPMSPDMLPMFGGYPDAPWAGGTGSLPPSNSYRFSLARGDAAIGADVVARAGMAEELDPRAYPYLTCEIGPGVQVTDHRRPLISPADAAALCLCKLGDGCNLPGFYVYHGGVNPDGRLSTLQESIETHYANDLPVKSYDFQTCLRESGRVDPKLREMRLLNTFVRQFGETLAGCRAVSASPAPSEDGDAGPLRCALRTDGRSGFVFVNNHLRGYPLPARRGARFRLEGMGESLTFPDSGLDVPAGAYGILPVGLKLGGVRLAWSTAQPLACLSVGGRDVAVCFPPWGERVEYAFDPGTVDGQSRFTVDVSSGPQELRVSGPGGTLDVVTLPRSWALGAVIAPDGGAMVLSDNDVYFDELGRLRMIVLDGAVAPVYVLGADRLSLDGGTLRAAAPLPGLMRLEVPRPDAGRPSVRIAPEGERAWRVVVPPEAFEGAREVYLRVDYRGNKAFVYAGERLVADDFFHGEVFEIALARLRRPLADCGGELVLRIEPVPDGARIYFDVPPDSCALVSVELAVETEVVL